MESSLPRTPYPSDVTDEERAFVSSYLALMTPHAPQQRYALREVYNALRRIVRTGAQWRYLPHEFPPWASRFRRWVRDYDRLPATVAGLHCVAFACLMVHRLITLAAQSP
jgi:transposase